MPDDSWHHILGVVVGYLYDGESDADIMVVKVEKLNNQPAGLMFVLRWTGNDFSIVEDASDGDRSIAEIRDSGEYIGVRVSFATNQTEQDQYAAS